MENPSAPDSKKNKEDIKRHLELLGLKAEDKVTKLKGIITCLSFDLYGCVQIVLTPEVDSKSGKKEDGHWLDVNRITLKSKKPVMKRPEFRELDDSEIPGCAEKPERRSI